jgi:hypothetical protein
MVGGKFSMEYESGNGKVRIYYDSFIMKTYDSDLICIFIGVRR